MRWSTSKLPQVNSSAEQKKKKRNAPRLRPLLVATSGLLVNSQKPLELSRREQGVSGCSTRTSWAYLELPVARLAH